MPLVFDRSCLCCFVFLCTRLACKYVAFSVTLVGKWFQESSRMAEKDVVERNETVLAPAAGAVFASPETPESLSTNRCFPTDFRAKEGDFSSLASLAACYTYQLTK